MTDQTGTGPAMPKYRCHKEVWALKIAEIEFETSTVDDEGRRIDGGAVITPYNEGPEIYASFRVDAEYVSKHSPRPGGYYVVYEGGYKSFSPAEPFESGYTKVDEIRVEAAGEALFNDRG